MYRAVFRRAGMDVVTCPFPDVLKRASSFGGRWERAWIEAELAKIVYYRFRGWM
jgi:hypothetical protein